MELWRRKKIYRKCHYFNGSCHYVLLGSSCVDCFQSCKLNENYTESWYCLLVIASTSIFLLFYFLYPVVKTPVLWRSSCVDFFRSCKLNKNYTESWYRLLAVASTSIFLNYFLYPMVKSPILLCRLFLVMQFELKLH